MDEPCSIQASYPSYIKKNETTEIVSQKSNFLGSPHQSAKLSGNFCYIHTQYTE